MKIQLTGDRNQCPSCCTRFNSSKAFDKHRTGRFGVDRRCLTVPEMEQKGMSANSEGFWITEQQSAESILSLRQTAQQPFSLASNTNTPPKPKKHL